MRVENSIKIAKAGIIYQIVTTILGFVNRVVFIKYLGSDYLGFSGLFTSILSMLSLAELGLGGAIVYNLYKPIAEQDEVKIVAFIRFYKKIYFGLAVFIFCIGMVFLPFIHIFIGDLDRLSFSLNYIRFIYFLSLLETVSSYLLVYKTTLLAVSQREYIITNINNISNILLTVVRLLFLIVYQNYVVYLVLGMIFRIGGNYVASRYAVKKFPYLTDEKYKNVRITKKDRDSLLSNAGNLSVHTLSSYVVNSTDSLIISTFVGITELGLFSNYNLIFSTIKSLIGSVVGSIQAPLGDLVVTGNKVRVKEVVNLTTHAFYLVASFCAISLAVLSSLFIEIVFGKEFLMGTDIILVCSINTFVWTMTRPIWKLSSVTGLFKDDRKNAVIEAGVNAVISVIAVQFLGITGTFIGTLCSYVVAFVCKTKLQYSQYFMESSCEYLWKIVKYSGLFILELIVVCIVCEKINVIISSLYVKFILNCWVCLIIPNVMNYIVFLKTEVNKYCIDLLKNKILKR